MSFHAYSFLGGKQKEISKLFLPYNKSGWGPEMVTIHSHCKKKISLDISDNSIYFCSTQESLWVWQRWVNDGNIVIFRWIIFLILVLVIGRNHSNALSTVSAHSISQRLSFVRRFLRLKLHIYQLSKNPSRMINVIPDWGEEYLMLSLIARQKVKSPSVSKTLQAITILFKVWFFFPFLSALSPLLSFKLFPPLLSFILSVACHSRENPGAVCVSTRLRLMLTILFISSLPCSFPHTHFLILSL